MNKKFFLLISILLIAIFFRFFTVSVKRRVPVHPREPALPKVMAKAAIVIDDWGYNMNNIELLDSIDMPITVAILPNLPFSSRIDERLRAKENREIIMHMPMEPLGEGVRLEKKTLLTAMDSGQIDAMLKSSLKTVPHAAGISNHMGSKATQDRRLIAAVMSVLKQKNIFFLDSLATPKSICGEEARALKLRFVKRDVFLDNKMDRKYISSQLDKLIKAAKRKGFAVAIGHDRRLTLEALKDSISRFRQAHIQLVLVSKLAD